MNEFSFECMVPPLKISAISGLLEDYTSKAEKYGFLASLEVCEEVPGDFAQVRITLTIDDEALAARKTGPKPVETSISIEEMARLRSSGVSAGEIASLAGISRATYFRRMNAYDAAREGKP